MQKVEDLTRSVSQLGQAIRDSYNFAYNSPAKAMNTLSIWTEYLQTKSTQSGLFVGGLLLAILDLLKNEHMKQLIESILGILEALVLLLQTEDCKLLLKSLINIAASKPIQLLIQCFGKIIKSLFYLMRTEEIEKFKIMARDLIKQLRQSQQSQNDKKGSKKKKNNNNNNKQNKHKKPPKAPGSARKDRSKCHNSKRKQATLSRDDSLVDNDRMSFCHSEPISPKCSPMFDSNNEKKEDSQREQQSWLTLPGFVGNILLSASSPPRPRDLNDDLMDSCYDSTSMSDIENDGSMIHMTNNGSDNDSDTDNDNNYNNGKARIQVCNELNQHINLRSRNKSNNNKTHNKSKKSTRSHENDNENDNGNNNGKQKTSFGFNTKDTNYERNDISDWVMLVAMIDQLQDDKKISLKFGKNLRKMAWQQNIQLMIIYKCYQFKMDRFVECCKELIESNNENENYMKIESNIRRKLETTLQQLVANEIESNVKKEKESLPGYQELEHELQQESQEMRRFEITENESKNKSDEMNDVMSQASETPQLQACRQRSGSLTGLATMLTSHATNYVCNMVGVTNNNNNNNNEPNNQRDTDISDSVDTSDSDDTTNDGGSLYGVD